MSHPHTSPSLPDAYPTLGELERYVRGELSPSEQERMDAYMEEDPFLADATDGLRQIKDPKQLRRRLQYLSRRNERLLQPDIHTDRPGSKRLSRVRPKLMPQLVMSIAAGLGLVILAVGLLRELGPRNTRTESADVPMTEAIAEGNLPEQIIVEKEADEKEAVPLQAPQRINEVPKEPLPDGNSPLALAPSVQPEPDEEITVGGDELANAMGGNQASAMEVETRSPVVEEQKLREGLARINAAVEEQIAQTRLAPGDVGDEQPAEEAAARSQIGEEPLSPKLQTARETRGLAQSQQYVEEADDFGYQQAPETRNARLVKGMNLYRDQQLNPALKEFKQVLEEEPTDPLANFYAGDIEYRRGRNRQAINYLNRVEEQESDELFDRSRWVLAQAYVAEGDSISGKAILNKLAAREGFYQDAARNLLQQWNEK